MNSRLLPAKKPEQERKLDDLRMDTIIIIKIHFTEMGGRV
jgi:hypothetical protein